MRLHTGVYGHRKKVCTESWLWEKNPLPHRGFEPVSAACRSDALPTELPTYSTCRQLKCGQHTNSRKVRLNNQPVTSYRTTRNVAATASKELAVLSVSSTQGRETIQSVLKVYANEEYWRERLALYASHWAHNVKTMPPRSNCCRLKSSAHVRASRKETGPAGSETRFDEHHGLRFATIFPVFISFFLSYFFFFFRLFVFCCNCCFNCSFYLCLFLTFFFFFFFLSFLYVCFFLFFFFVVVVVWPALFYGISQYNIKELQSSGSFLYLAHGGQISQCKERRKIRSNECPSLRSSPLDRVDGQRERERKSCPGHLAYTAAWIWAVWGSHESLTTAKVVTAIIISSDKHYVTAAARESNRRRTNKQREKKKNNNNNNLTAVTTEI